MTGSPGTKETWSNTKKRRVGSVDQVISVILDKLDEPDREDAVEYELASNDFDKPQSPGTVVREVPMEPNYELRVAPQGLKDTISIIYVPSKPTKKRGQVSFFVDDPFGKAEDERWVPRYEKKEPPSEGCYVDIYDAITAQMMLAGEVKIVQCLQAKRVCEVIRSGGNQLMEFQARLLFWPNWLFETKCRSLESLHLFITTILQPFLTANGLVIFPPIDYCLFFGRKEFWIQEALCLSRPQSSKTPLWDVIPTTVILPGECFSKLDLAGKNNRIVLKRTVSERSHHVFKDVFVTGGTISNLPRDFDRWTYLAQPYISEFQRSPEYRIYLVKGRAMSGLATFWGPDGKLHFDHVHPFTNNAAHSAFTAACAVVRNFSSQFTGYFVRVDLVCNSQNGGWWLNEMEYFGNADILLPDDSGAPIMRIISEAVASWMGDVINSCIAT